MTEDISAVTARRVKVVPDEGGGLHLELTGRSKVDCGWEVLVQYNQVHVY